MILSGIVGNIMSIQSMRTELLMTRYWVLHEARYGDNSSVSTLAERGHTGICQFNN